MKGFSFTLLFAALALGLAACDAADPSLTPGPPTETPPPILVQPIPDAVVLMSDTPVQIVLTDHFARADGAALQFAAGHLGSDEAVAIAVSGSTLRLSPRSIGNARVVVTAYDGGGRSQSDTLGVRVSSLALLNLTPSAPNTWDGVVELQDYTAGAATYECHTLSGQTSCALVLQHATGTPWAFVLPTSSASSTPPLGTTEGSYQARVTESPDGGAYAVSRYEVTVSEAEGGARAGRFRVTFFPSPTGLARTLTGVFRL